MVSVIGEVENSADVVFQTLVNICHDHADHPTDDRQNAKRKRSHATARAYTR